MFIFSISNFIYFRIGFKWNVKEDIWKQRFHEVIAFKEEFGHTKVSRSYKNKELGRWVNYQRSQFKYFIEGKKSQLTRERIHLLNSIGFIWTTTRQEPWEVRFEELKRFKIDYGHVFVPSQFAKNPKLGAWYVFNLCVEEPFMSCTNSLFCKGQYAAHSISKRSVRKGKDFTFEQRRLCVECTGGERRI